MGLFDVLNETLHKTKRYDWDDAPEDHEVPQTVIDELSKKVHEAVDKKMSKIEYYSDLEIIYEKLNDEIQNLFDEAAETEEYEDCEDEEDDDEYDEEDD